MQYQRCGAGRHLEGSAGRRRRDKLNGWAVQAFRVPRPGSGMRQTRARALLTRLAVSPGRCRGFREIRPAGGFDHAKANMKAVVVIRQENNRTERFKLNLKQVLDGQRTEQFDLQPSDIIYVPERFSWF